VEWVLGTERERQVKAGRAEGFGVQHAVHPASPEDIAGTFRLAAPCGARVRRWLDRPWATRTTPVCDDCVTFTATNPRPGR